MAIGNELAWMLAEAEKRERRKADDRRRQKLFYYRKTGKVPPKTHAETSCGGGDRHDDETSTAPSPSPPPMGTAPSPSNEPSISHGDPVRDVKSHTSNGQTAPTALARPPHKADKLTIAEWEAKVHKYRISGDWSWRSLGPSPRFPKCRAPSFILAKHGYPPQAT